MLDNIQPRGSVKLQIYRDGELVEVIEQKNLIVTGGRTILSRLLAAPVAADAITKIAVGSSVTPPAMTDTAPLANQFAKAITSYSYPTAGQVMFSWEILAGEAVGINIAEYALLSEGEELFSRITRNPFLKGAERIVGEWTINLNA